MKDGFEEIFGHLDEMVSDEDKKAFTFHCLGWLASAVPPDEIRTMIRTFDERSIYSRKVRDGFFN